MRNEREQSRNEGLNTPTHRGRNMLVRVLDIVYGAGTAGTAVDGILKSNGVEAAIGTAAFVLPVGYLAGRAITLRRLGR